MIKEPAYSQYILSKDIIYTAGQLSINDKGQVVGKGDIKKQTKKALENLKSILLENDFKFENITSVTIYLQNIERDFIAMDEAYREVFKDCKPARTTVEAKLFNPDWLIELNVIASKHSSNKH